MSHIRNRIGHSVSSARRKVASVAEGKSPMYSFQGHLKDGRTFTVQHHEQNPTIEALQRIAENTVAGVAAHMIVKFVSKGKVK